MDAEDITECLANLFLENEEKQIKFSIKSFYTAKHNEALIVNNFVYHRKTSQLETLQDGSATLKTAQLHFRR